MDSHGEWLDGSKSYRLTLPADAPVKDFWSVVVYDPQTRCQLQTGQPLPGLNNLRGELQTNPDSSVTLFFGATAPDGLASNWIQTVAGKGWFAVLRLYGPTQAWFDQTWWPGEIETIDG